MLQRRQAYECGPEQLWQRGMGLLSPLSYARQVGGSQDLIKRLQLYAKLDGHDGCVNTVHFNPSGDILVSGSDDMKIVLWDWAAKLKRLAFSSGHVNNVFQARIMPMSDDHCIVSCAADGQVRLAEILEDGEVHTKKLAEHKGRAHKLAIEPGSPRIFLSCGEDGIVRHVYKGHRNAKTVKGVNFFGPNSEYVVSGSDCGRIFIWKKKGGELVSLLLGDKQIVNCLEPHPHATILATSGIEKNVKVWCPTAAAPSPLPNDAEKIMEQNAVQRDGRTRLSLTPDVIMYLLQLQRRHEGSELNRQYLRADYNSDNDGSHDEYMDLCFSDSDDAGDNSVEPANCLIN